MSVQFSAAVQNAMLDALETAIGTGAVLKLYDLTAGAPANVGASITGTVLATITCPSDWMSAAASGVKAKLGTWSDSSADGAGTADFYRLFASDGTTCHMQGTVTLTAGGGDMTLDNTNVTAGQAITVSSFSLDAAND